jgi:uncharacterized protein (DUF1697 family)
MSEPEAASTEADFNALKALQADAQELERIEHLLSRFNAFETTVGFDKDEVVHSDLLASLLDPRRTGVLGERLIRESLGFSNVETFIASGNVIFDSPAEGTRKLEQRIEAHLRESLGYEVATFVRSGSELVDVAGYEPFVPSELNVEGNPLYIAFLQASPTFEAEQKLMAFRSEVDDFRVNGREVYWPCRKKMSESVVSGALLEKTVEMPATIRNATTVQKLAAKYSASR